MVIAIGKFEQIKRIILNYIYLESGWGKPQRNDTEFEELTILEIHDMHDGSNQVDFEYLYNEDGFSKNDMTHILVGNVLIGPTGKIMEQQLKEIHRGIAVKRIFKGKK